MKKGEEPRTKGAESALDEKIFTVIVSVSELILQTMILHKFTNNSVPNASKSKTVRGELVPEPLGLYFRIRFKSSQYFSEPGFTTNFRLSEIFDNG